MIFFLPNGYGDLIMAVPAIRFLINIVGEENLAIVVLTVSHAELLKYYIGNNVKYIIRRDGNKLSNLRLFFNLLFNKKRNIILPMVSKKLINKLFFALLPHEIITHNFFNIITKKNIRYFPYSLNTYKGHQVNYLMDFVSYTLKLNSVASEYLLAAREIKPHNNDKIKICLGISCGLSERHKIPTTKYFADLVNYLHEMIHPEFHIISTKSDDRVLKSFASHLNANILIYNHIDLSIVQLADIIPKCDIGIAGMSGQGHLIGSFDLPMVIFAGVTNPKESAPFVSRAVIVSHKYLCGPCYQEGFLYGCGIHNCMDSIDKERVLDAIKFLLLDSSNGLNWLDSCSKNTLSVSDIKLNLGKFEEVNV